ncbi:MAG: hemerythrin family protein [Candidatus Brocadiaceae bacterium]|nr:hemerythrin family protein [Candidatus Brocadiaceae bacterium]
MLSQWHNDLTTGNAIIDTENQELFSKVHSFMNTVHSQKSSIEVAGMLGYLSRYIIRHFHDEEALMSEYGYDGLNIHKKEHIQFAKEINSIGKKVEDIGITEEVVSQLKEQLSRWLEFHVNIEDKKLADCIRNKKNKSNS